MSSDTRSDLRIARTGIGSLYWAARHPEQAAKVVLPVEPGAGAYEDLREQCLATRDSTDGPTDCP